jgi:hypothetical protein
MLPVLNPDPNALLMFSRPHSRTIYWAGGYAAPGPR